MRLNLSELIKLPQEKAGVPPVTGNELHELGQVDGGKIKLVRTGIG
jgi:hypothetical protein